MRAAKGGVAEAYSLVRKAAQVLERAAEAEPKGEVRLEIDRALRLLYKAEDGVVAASKAS